MTCDTATLLIHFARPGTATDLAAEDRAALDAHLATCPNCSMLVNRHGAEDAAIAAAMKAVTVPVGFRDALQTQAFATRNAIWRATWLRLFASTAAAVAFALLSYGALANLTKPTLDCDKVLADFEIGGGSSSLDFDNWRQTEGVPSLPDDFDLQLLSFTGRLPLQGTQVPAIRLRAGPGQDAILYFVRNSRFDLSSAKGAIGSQGMVHVYADQPGWTIIFVHTGNSPQPFFHRPGSSA
jgi:hypothetical protein